MARTVRTYCRPITFGPDDLASVNFSHNDPLVISIDISKNEVSRVMINTESSVNVIYRNVLEKMKVPIHRIKPSIRPLTGFDGNHMMSSRTIKLPIYIGRTAVWHKFIVIDKPAIYNIILGTPWIHDMHAVPSTYHQCVKLPIGKGVYIIRGNQQIARSCFVIECILRKAEDL